MGTEWFWNSLFYITPEAINNLVCLEFKSSDIVPKLVHSTTDLGYYSDVF